MKNLIVIFLFIVSSVSLFSQYTAVTSGDWDDPVTWGGTLPSDVPPNPIDANLTINAGVVVTMVGNLTTVSNQNYDININGELNDGGNGYSLTIEKKWDLIIDGTLNIHTLNLEAYNGTNRPIGTFTANANVTLNVLNSGGIINNAGTMTITEGFNLTDGEINNTGTITATNFTNDGSITNDGTISVTGTLTNNGSITNNDGTFGTPNNGAVFNAGTVAGTGTVTGTLNQTLSVELKNFEGISKDQSIWLSCSLEHANNIEYFEISHSIDGFNFDPLFIEYTSFINTEKFEFQFEHQYPGSGLNYYSLNKIDEDGKNTHLKTIAVQNNINTGSEMIYSLDNSMVSLRSNNQEQLKVLVYDLSGRIIKESELFGYELRLDLGGLHSGIYILRYSNGLHDESKKIYIP